jgi:hypothetical protein
LRTRRALVGAFTAGNSGLIVGTPSDPRTVGVALRAKF